MVELSTVDNLPTASLRPVLAEQRGTTALAVYVTAEGSFVCTERNPPGPLQAGDRLVDVDENYSGGMPPTASQICVMSVDQSIGCS